MNQIDIYIPFDESAVDKKNYAASLLMLSSLHGMISEEKAESVQRISTEMFLETLEQFTYRKSGSVQKENAKRIYESVFYRADAYFYSLGTLTAAVRALQNEDFSEILKKGSRVVLEKFNTAEKYALLARKYALRRACDEYTKAIASFSKFKKKYSARFYSKNNVENIDYPLLYGNPETEGALFMADYYKGLYTENLFFSLFDVNAVEKLLTGYGRMYGCHYTALCENYCAVALNNFFANLVVEKRGRNLQFSEADMGKLIAKLCSADTEAIKKQLVTAFYKEIASHEIRFYIRKYADIFIRDLYSHYVNGTLESFVVIC